MRQIQTMAETTSSIEKPPKILINPPPTSGRCECCGKHVTELKPFGKAGDPLVGDFNGAFLVKFFRCQFPDSEYESIMCSWECRDCILLEDDEYFKIISERFAKEN